MSAGDQGQRRVSEALVRMPQEQRQEDRALACSAQRQHGPVWGVASVPAPPTPHPRPLSSVSFFLWNIVFQWGSALFGFMYSDCPKSAKVHVTTPTHPKKQTNKNNNNVSSGDQVGCWWHDLVALSPHGNNSVMLSCGDASSKIFYSLWSPRPTEQMSCPWLPSVAGVVPPCSGLKRTPSSDFFPPFFFSSPPPRESVLPSNEIFRCAVCWSVWPWPTVASFGCLFTSLVSLSLLRRLAAKKSPQGCCEMHLPHQTEFANAWKCFCMMFHYSRCGGTNLYIDAYTNSRHF